jgi:hypothetical protein
MGDNIQKIYTLCLFYLSIFIFELTSIFVKKILLENSILIKFSFL